MLSQELTYAVCNRKCYSFVSVYAERLETDCQLAARNGPVSNEVSVHGYRTWRLDEVFYLKNAREETKRRVPTQYLRRPVVAAVEGDRTRLSVGFKPLVGQKK